MTNNTILNIINNMSNQVSKFVANGTQIKGSIPFAKVDIEKRTVRGWATLDNVDLHGDVVTFDATREAFAKTSAKIREMHQPRVAGTIASFEEAEFTDPETGQLHKGMIIEAKISKGNEDAWQLVLDGCYTAFSIGGDITESENQFVKDGTGKQKSVRFIKGYSLNEISLVDNGGNQYANFLSVEKSADGTFVKGMVTEPTYNVFRCPTDEVARTVPEETAECSICEKSMDLAGWVKEVTPEAVHEVIQKFLNQQEGGITKMSEENTEKVDETTSVEESTESPAEESSVITSGDEQNKEDETKVDESEHVENDLEKAFSDLKKTVEDNTTEFHKKVEGLEQTIAKVSETFETKTEEIFTKHKELSDTLEEKTAKVEELEKSLTALTSSLQKTATKSSEESETKLEKTKDSSWGGRFLS